MALHARLPYARQQASAAALGQESDLSHQQALQGLAGAYYPKDASGFDQGGPEENIATYLRAKQMDQANVFNQMHQPITPGLGGANLIPRPEDELLKQALYEHAGAMGGRVKSPMSSLLASSPTQAPSPASSAEWWMQGSNDPARIPGWSQAMQDMTLAGLYGAGPTSTTPRKAAGGGKSSPYQPQSDLSGA